MTKWKQQSKKKEKEMLLLHRKPKSRGREKQYDKESTSEMRFAVEVQDGRTKYIKTGKSLADWKGKGKKQKVEIRERDSGRISLLACGAWSHWFHNYKRKTERRKPRSKRAREEERKRERGSCLVSAPQSLSQPLWEIDRTPSVCQTRLHNTPALKPLQLHVYQCHTIKQHTWANCKTPKWQD